MLVLFRKEDLIDDMSMSHQKHNAASLATLFRLYCNDETAKLIGDTAKVRDGAIRSVLDKSIKGMSREISSWSFESRRLEVEREREEFASVFNQVADFCYTIQQPDLVHHALQGIMRDEKWTSSTALVNVVAHQVAREPAGNGAQNWDAWYFAVELAAAGLMLNHLQAHSGTSSCHIRIREQYADHV